MAELLKKPSAWIPIAIPLAFFLYIAAVLSMYGATPRGQDEGMGARLFQLWLVSEPFLVGYFLFRWYPDKPRETLLVLALQLLAALLAVFPVFYFHL